MSAQPCLNKACNSYGSPHPNCRCYGGMASGGTVERFCSTTREHKSNCHYAKGGFALENETEHHYTVKHPKGDLLKIAKKGLSQELRAHIKGFAKGGEVKNPISEGFINATGTNAIKQGLQHIKNYDEGGQVDAGGQKPVTININTSQDRQPAGSGQPDPALLQKVRQQMAQPKPGAMTMSDLGHMLTAPIGGSQIPQGGVPYSSQFAGADEWQKYNNEAAMRNSQATEPVATGNTSPAPQPYQNVQFQAPQVPQASTPQNPTAQASSDYTRQLQGDIGMYQKGVGQQTTADTQVGKGMEDLLAKRAQFHQEFVTGYQKSSERILGEMEKINKELNTGDVDFNQLWHEKGTGSKILAGIGMLLSGVGSGLTGQPNLAMKAIDDAINRDIESQKMNFQKKRTALEGYHNLLGDQSRAAEHLRLGYDAAVVSQVEKLRNQQAGPLAQSRANMALAQWLPPMQERLHQAAMSQTMMTMMGRLTSGGAPADAQDTKQALAVMDVMDKPRADDLRKKYIPELNKFADRPVEEKDQAEISKRLQLHKDWNELVNNMQDLRMSDRFDRNKIANLRAKAALLLNTFRQSEGLGVPREASQEFEKAIIDQNPDSFFASLHGTLGKYSAALEDNLNKLNSKTKSLGIGTVPLSVAGAHTKRHNEVMNVANRPR